MNDKDMIYILSAMLMISGILLVVNGIMDLMS
jgi:hypothetical protein